MGRCYVLICLKPPSSLEVQTMEVKDIIKGSVLHVTHTLTHKYIYTHTQHIQYIFERTLMSGDSSTTTIGSLACSSGRIVTVRILELTTAGGLQRHTVIQKYYF